MTSNTSIASRLWEPGMYNVPHVLSLLIQLIAFFSLLLNWGMPDALRDNVPVLFRIEPITALAFLLLALSTRMARWERIDARTALRAKLSRVLASFAVLLVLGSSRSPILLVGGLCMLSATVILQAYSSNLAARRILLTLSLIVSTWLVLANLYAVHGRISLEWTAGPSSAMLLLALTLALSLKETRTGLIPDSLTSVLGEKASVRLLVSALLVPLLLGYLRLQLEDLFELDANLLLALHVLGTLLVMGALLVFSMDQAKDRLIEQRRIQSDLEATENVLRSLLAQGSEFYLTMNLAGRLLEANENTIRYLGLPDLQKAVVCIEDLILRESHEKMRRLPEALLRGVSENAVLLFRMADGEALPLYVAAACRMRHGSPTEIVLVGRSSLEMRKAQSGGPTLLATA
ncbi:MAG: hypothetical protein ABIQ44_13190 [Chloroflexia bacterium]